MRRRHDEKKLLVVTVKALYYMNFEKKNIDGSVFIIKWPIVIFFKMFSNLQE